ncbi:MAG: single-stranded-DNA-specific exonuclease RecJ [Gemella sp.]|nr:single-stranded-DNA-specific exonuclease RecJ [Gemella sp.]
MGIKYNWKLPDYNDNKIKELMSTYNVSENIAKVLYSREITQDETIRNYLIGEYDEGYDPFLMYDMDKAVERINIAIENEEKILIYGDYDADGITSTVLMYETLSSLGANVSTYIPSRFTEGYGPNKKAFGNIIDSGVTLIITVDNGIAAVEEIKFAQSLGCDVILTDHHQIQEEIPKAYAVIHPEHPLASYPFGKLAGVGVAFKLAHALLGIYPDFLLDLVAIGSIADMVPVYSENRIFIKQGLKLLNEDPRLGIKLLLEKANHKTTIDEQTIGFIISPRLNSIGRMANAKEGVALLTIEDEQIAYQLIEQIEQHNIERKSTTEKIVLHAQNSINENNDILIMYSDEYHEGVLGIVASNLVEKYKKPVLIAKKENDILKGSARSFLDFNIYEALYSLKDNFIAFGGHHSAAGFSIHIDNLEEIQKKLNFLYTEYLQTSTGKNDKIIDLKIDFDNVSYQLLNDLDFLKPYGNNFESVTILSTNVSVVDKIYFGNEKQYLRLLLGDTFSNLEAITFKDTKDFDVINAGDVIDIIYNLSKNYFNGRTKLQIQIIDVMKKDFLFYDSRENNIIVDNLDKNELKITTSYTDINNNYYTYKELDTIPRTFSIINLLDIPTSSDQISKILDLNPIRINLAYKPPVPLYKKYKIDKNRLIKLFNLLLKYNKLELNNKASLINILNFLNTNIESLKLMLTILEELNLCKNVKNIIILNKEYTAIELENSVTYATMKDRFYIEQIFTEYKIQDINRIFSEN